MKGAQLLAVIAGFQAAFLILFTALLIGRHRRLEFAAQVEARWLAPLHDAFARWAAGGLGTDGIVEGLRRAPRRVVLQTLLAYGDRVPREAWESLASALRAEDWVNKILRQARARFWWRRLEAARLAGILASRQDVGLLRALLADPHPAVNIAAVTALPSVSDPGLVEVTMERLPHLPPMVRYVYEDALLQTERHTVALLGPRLTPARTERELAAWTELAGRLRDPSLAEPLAALGAHESFEVRAAVARALGGLPTPRALKALLGLAADPDWRVRVNAAHGLGRLGHERAVPVLEERLRDLVWWVRLRAALALRRLGEPGVQALRRADRSDDPYAADMARYVLGLSEGALAEYDA